MAYKESYTVELKRELNADFKKEIIALVNCDGGEIYVGVDDNGKVIGIENAEKAMEAIGNIDAEYIFFSSDTDKCELENHDFDFIITDDTAVSDDILSYLENNENTKCIIISPFSNTHANSHINAKIINKPV